MKLATLRGPGRDGHLAVVRRDLGRAAEVGAEAATLQAALDDWDRCAPILEALQADLDAGRVEGRPFDPAEAAAPLPRAFQWLDASAYLNHVELVRRARGVAMPASAATDPIMYQGGSDPMLGPRDPIEVGDADAWAADFEAEVAVIVGDVARGAGRAEAMAAIRLVTVVNDVSLRGLIPDELAKGFGFIHGKPPTAFAPVAVTLDELGDAWDGARLSLPLEVRLNGVRFGYLDTGGDMTFDFADLIVHAARTRPLRAGAILGAGTVSNRDAATGAACIVERRVREQLDGGEARTPYLRPGDRVRIEIFGRDGASVFGAIDQTVVETARG